METINNISVETTLQVQENLKAQPEIKEQIIKNKCNTENTGSETCILFMANNFRHLDF